MQRSRRYLLAPIAGLAAGGVSYLGVLSAVDSGLGALVAVFNGVVWTVAVGLYVAVYGRLNHADRRLDERSQWASAKFGGLSGGVTSLGVTGTIALFAAVGPFRVGAAVGLFVFGAVLASMAVGMLAVVRRFDGESRGGTGAGGTHG